MGLVRNLGELGVVGALRVNTVGKIAFVIYRDGAAWDYSGYTDTLTLTLKVADLRTRTAVALTGTLAAGTTPANGEVLFTPGADELLDANSGVFEGRVYLREASGEKIPSDPFTYTIGDAPGP